MADKGGHYTMQRNMKLILMSLLLLTASVLLIFKFLKPKEIQTISAALTAEELLKYTVEVEEITTNLHGKGFAQLKFQLQADSTKAKDELQYRKIQIRHLIIQTLSSVTLEDLKGEKGIAKLEQSVQSQINQMMESGHVLKIFSTKLLLQE